MPYGFVYVLGNQWMPNLYKIGMTERSPSLRALELASATGVPDEFEVIAFAEFSNCAEAEELVHYVLDSRRVNPGREFFRVEDINEIYDAFFRAWEVLDVLPCTSEAILAHIAKKRQERRKAVPAISAGPSAEFIRRETE